MVFSNQLESRINAIIEPCHAALTAGAIDRSNNGVNVCAFLYYQPSTEKDEGKLSFFFDEETAPDGWVLATGEGLRGNIPFAEYRRWIRSRVSRLPILAWGK